MDQGPLTTPSATPSSDSMRQRGNYEPSSPILISSSSSEQHEFKPLQMLMQTPVTIECGPDLSSKLVLHEELLRCHSKLLQERFSTAKTLQQQYERANTLRSQIAAHVFPEVTAHDFEQNNHQEQAMPLIVLAYDQYPLPGYAQTVRKTIIDATQDQVQLKNVKPRMLHDAIRETKWKARIAYMDSSAVCAITEKLYSKLYQIHKAERAKANNDVMRAAAQKRILVPGVGEETIKSMMQWVYHEKLECQDPQQLYDTLQLATQLGLEALEEVCLTRLCNAASDSIQNALTTGESLKSLMGYGTGQTDNVIQVIFKHVLKDHNTPKRLQELVVATLATSLDTMLWAELKDLVSHSVALQLIDAMLEYRQEVAAATLDHDVIKSEVQQVRAASPIYAADD